MEPRCQVLSISRQAASAKLHSPCRSSYQHALTKYPEMKEIAKLLEAPGLLLKVCLKGLGARAREEAVSLLYQAREGLGRA